MARLPRNRPGSRLVACALAWLACSATLADDDLPATDRAGSPAAAFTGLAQAPEATLFAGAVTTSIPIDLPPGRKSVTPHLALVYNSRGGAGPYGHGWHLPLGRIRRDTRHGVVACDDHDRQREFLVELPDATVACRLDPESGGRRRCRAKLEQAYLRIYFDAETNHWDVWDPSGGRYAFGTDESGRAGADRRQLRSDGPGCPGTHTWALQHFRDANGNHVDIDYEHDEGTLYPTRIAYGGHLDSSLAHVFAVDFLWQERRKDDRPVDARMGSPARLRRLLDRIDVRIVGEAAPVRTYDLTYDVDLDGAARPARRGFLRAVTLYGRSGLALARHDGLPAATTFLYRDDADASHGFVGQPVAPPASELPPALHQTDSSDEHAETVVALRDMNGDGFVDLVDARGCNRQHHPFWNVFLGAASGFATAPVAWLTAPGATYRCKISHARISGADSETRHETIDLDGDGIPDWIDASTVPWTVYRGRADAEGGGFSPPVPWPARAFGIDPFGRPVLVAALRATARGHDWIDLVDWNGDGLLDLASAVEGVVRLNDGSGFDTVGTPVVFPEGRLRATQQQRLTDALVDMNGDSLPDHVRDLGSGHWQIRWNDGRKLATSAETWTVPLTCAAGLRDRTGGTDTWRELIDVNGDRLPDLVDTCRWSPAEPYWDVYLNRATGFATEPLRWQTEHARLRFETRGRVAQTLRDIVDVDGDGHADLLEVGTGPGRDWRLHRNRLGYWGVGCGGLCREANPGTADADALVAIENGVGARTSLTYAPSTIGDHRDRDGRDRLPLVLWNVARIAEDSGMRGIGGAPRRSIDIHYQSGFFDPEERQFRGFGVVETVEADGARERTHYGQDPATEGRVLHTATLPPGRDVPLRSSENRWECFRPDDGDAVPCASARPEVAAVGIRLAARHTTDHGSDGEQRHSWREQRAWDRYGNALHVRVGGDDTASVDTSTEFAHADDLDAGGTRYLVRLASRVTVAAGATLEDRWFFYDDLPLGAVARGNLTRTESWLDTSVVTAPACTAEPRRRCVATSIDYDDHGNPIAVTDPRGATATTTYDAAGLHPTQVTNALGHVVESAHDRGCGKLLVQTLPDSRVASRFDYDDFCRLRAVLAPEQSPATAERRFEYHLGSPGVPSRIATRRFEPASPAGWVDVHELFDGFGRRLQRQADAVVDGAGVIVVSDTAIYDSRGRAVVAYPPFVVDGEASTSESARHARYRAPGTEAQTRLWYDARDRIVWTLSSNGSERRADFSSPWHETVTGECFHDPSCSGSRTTKAHDARGNVVEKVVEGEDGSVLARTGYGYDGLGRQTWSMQSDGTRWLPRTRIRTEYDSLGRRIEIDDPDSGRWRFGYDLAGNLVYQDDPEPGRHLELCYDALNRLTQKHVVGGSDRYRGDACDHPEQAVARSTFDDPAIPHGIGRLAQMDDASGFTRFHAYDARGNALVVEKGIRVGDVVETATTSYRYGLAGHLTHVVYPDGERVAYTYDESGNVRALHSESDGTVLLADLTYDRFGRPRQITHGNGPDGIGVVDTREYHGHDQGFRLARITTTTAASDLSCGSGRRALDVRYDRYDIGGRLTVIAIESECGGHESQATYRYDGLGRLVASTGPAAAEFVHDVIGNPVEMDGVTIAYGSRRPHTPTGLGSVELEHDRNGNRVRKGDKHYSFDAEDRLVAVDGGRVEIAYDANGARVRQSDGVTDTRFFHELADYRLERGHPVLTKHYFAGDLRIASREAIWRPETRPTDSGWIAAIGADATANRLGRIGGTLLSILVLASMLPSLPTRNGRRRRSAAAIATTIAFAYALLASSLSPLGVATVAANGGPGARTQPLPTVIAEPIELAFVHYHVDRLGSPHVVSDGSGAVLEHRRYEPYGALLGRWNADGQPLPREARIGFAGYEPSAEVGLHYAGLRWYDPKLGGFASHDPARQFPNPYSYGGGDPINGIDRGGALFGLDDLLVAVIVGAVAGAVGGGVQAAIDGASVGQALKAAAIGGTIGGAAAYVGAGFVGPLLNDTVVPSVASQLANAGVAPATAGTIAEIAVRGSAISAGLAQVGYQASAGNYGPLVGLGVAIGLHTALSPPQPATPDAGLRLVATAPGGELPSMGVADLAAGDVLITDEGAMASVTGHSAVVLEAEGDIVRVLSADQRGRYIETNLDGSVGGRQWDVYRVGGLDIARLHSAARALHTRGGLQDYLGNAGGNVCSATCAAAIEAAGGPVAPRSLLNLVSPAALRRTYGPPIGRVFIPRLRSI